MPFGAVVQFACCRHSGLELEEPGHTGQHVEPAFCVCYLFVILVLSRSTCLCFCSFNLAVYLVKASSLAQQLCTLKPTLRRLYETCISGR